MLFVSENFLRKSIDFQEEYFQACRGYGYPWIYPWIYPCVVSMCGYET